MTRCLSCGGEHPLEAFISGKTKRCFNRDACDHRRARRPRAVVIVPLIKTVTG